MIKLDQLSLEFGIRFLFKDINVYIGPADKVGLVGKNGAGKSTMLKVLLGMQAPTAGSVIKPKDYTIGYLPQELELSSALPVRDEVKQAFAVSNTLEKRMEELGVELAVRHDYESESYLKLAEELNKVSTQLGLYDLGSQEEQVERVLLGLGFSQNDMEQPVNQFSGGWKMRMALAKILLQKPDLVLLDEPTNHLDIESVQWLEVYLKNYPGAVVLISHDRVFLDQVTNRTVELVNGKAYDYPASYSKFVELRAEVIQQQLDARKNQERELKQTEALINKFRAKASKASFAQSLIKKMDRMELIEVDDEETARLHFRFRPAPRSGKVVVKAEQLSKNYGDKKVFAGLDFEIERGAKVALVGKNGVGKTTLTKVIAGLTAYQGHCELGHMVDLGYYSQNQSDELPGGLTVLEVIDNEATGEYRKGVRNLLGAFMFHGDDVHKQVKVLSGGEKARLALCKLLLHPYNFLILDEPTNHLDMRSKDVLKEALQLFEGTILVVSHDRDFLAGLCNQVMEIKDGAMTIFPGNIAEFLERRNAESIKEFEHNGSLRQKQQEEQKQTSGDEKERWQLSKKLTALERDIERLEEELRGITSQFENPDAIDPNQIKNHHLRVAQLEKKLASKMQEWEEVAARLETLAGT
jgi:ATP-binding cassette subfamily F protein 3